MQNQMDYIFFLYGASFFMLGVVAWLARESGEKAIPWRWLAGFGFAHGVNEWLDMLSISLADKELFYYVRLTVMLLSFLFLVEFGRKCCSLFFRCCFGRWIYIPLLLITFSGLLHGWDGMNATGRYGLGFTGSILSGIGFLHFARNDNRQDRIWLSIAGIFFLIYGLATGLIVGKNEFFPASCLNQEWFMIQTGFPIQIIRAFAALIISGCVWRSCQTEDLIKGDWIKRLQIHLLPIVLFLVVGGGWLITEWQGNMVKYNRQQQLLLQAREVAAGFDWNRLANLYASGIDRNHHLETQLCRQLESYGKTINCLRIFIISANYDDRMILDSNGMSHENRQIYKNEVNQVIKTKLEECFSFKKGSMTLALTPINVDSLNNNLFLIGIEKDTFPWSRSIANARLSTISGIMLLTLLLIIGIYVLSKRESFTPSIQKHISYLETYLCLAIGLSLTVLLSWLLYKNENNIRQQDFVQLSMLHANRVQLRMKQLQDIELLPIKMFYECSEDVTVNEFHDFMAPLMKNFMTYRICAAKYITEKDVGDFTTKMKSDGFADFRIFEIDASWKKVAAGKRMEYMPLIRNEPLIEGRAAIGFDLFSEPLRKSALKEMQQTRMPIGTDPIFTSSDKSRAFVAYAPIFKPAPLNTELNWVVMLVFRPEVVMNDIFNTSKIGTPVSINLYILSTKKSPTLLGGWPPLLHNRHRQLDENDYRMVYPIFVLGRSYAVVVDAQKDFFAANPIKIGWLAAIMGSLITIILTLLIWFLNNRRLKLQELVEIRTAELMAIQRHRSSELESLVKLRTEELRASEQLLSATFRSIGDGVIQVNENEIVTGMNTAAEQLTGWSNETAVGQPLIHIFKLVNALTKEPMEDPASKILSGEKIATISNDVLLIDRQGNERRISDSAAPIRDRQGNMLGVVLIFRDITQQFSLEEKLRQSQKMEAVGQLAGGVAHDFNNMLTGILGAAQLLPRKLDSPQTRNQLIKIIIESTERAAGLTRKLLDFSRKGKLESMSVDMHGVINSAISLLERSIDPKIKLGTVLNASSSVVNGDPSQLQNAILNMGINARDAMPDGGEMWFETRNITLTDNDSGLLGENLATGEYLEVVVRDTGTGMSQAVQKHIFEPFFTTKEVGKGTGLGLSAVYGMVMDHHGSIHVYSEEGKGSAFKIYLPVDNGAKEIDREKEKLIIAAPANCRVMVVDDEDIIRDAAKAILEDLGYQVVTAIDGADAVQILSKDPSSIDVIILDMIMPKMNGRDAFFKIREIAPEMPVIFSSGFTSDKITNELLNDRFVYGFVQKPYLVATLADALNRAVSTHQTKEKNSG